MTDQVSISTTAQGTGLAATAAKAQSGGKGAAFLGMLMAAIGHKPADGAGSASGLVHTGKNAKKIAGKGLLLIDATSTGKKHAAATKSAAAALLIDAAGKDKKHAAAKAHGATDASASLIGTAAKGNADSAADAAMADMASAQANADQGSANKQEGHKHRHKEASPSLATASLAAMQPTVTPGRADAAPGLQDNGIDGSKKPADAAALNAAHASLASKGMASATAENVQASQKASEAGTEEASAKSQTTRADANALSASQGKRQAAQAPGQTGAALTTTMLADASGQATKDTHKARGTGEETANASSQSGDSQTAAAAQQAKHAIAGMTGVHGKAQAHGDADAHPGASHPSDAQDSQATAAASSKPGMHSYARIAAAHTLAQAATTTAMSHQTLPAAGGHHDATMAQASAPGQDLAMGTGPLTAAPGVGQSTQTMSMPQMTAPQASAHVSGPWTVMAAMAEIGQAAATGMNRLELKLEPAHLGKVHVRIDSDHRKNIQVHLVVEQPGSRQAIEQQLPNLRHALEQQGLNLGNFSMSSQGQSSGQGSGQPGQQPAAASAPSFNAPQTQAPQMTNTPTELPASGRLSIRV